MDTPMFETWLRPCPRIHVVDLLTCTAVMFETWLRPCPRIHVVHLLMHWSNVFQCVKNAVARRLVTGTRSMSVVYHGRCMTTCTGWFFLSECSTSLLYDSSSLASAPSAEVPRRLLHASLRSPWSPASAICQKSSTVSSTSSP